MQTATNKHKWGQPLVLSVSVIVDHSLGKQAGDS